MNTKAQSLASNFVKTTLKPYIEKYNTKGVIRFEMTLDEIVDSKTFEEFIQILYSMGYLIIKIVKQQCLYPKEGMYNVLYVYII